MVKFITIYVKHPNNKRALNRRKKTIKTLRTEHTKTPNFTYFSLCGHFKNAKMPFH